MIYINVSKFFQGRAASDSWHPQNICSLLVHMHITRLCFFSALR